MHPVLYEEIRRREQNVKIPIAIWLSIKDELIDKSKFELGRLRKNPKNCLNIVQKYLKFNPRSKK